jgi:hypothetical protein
MSERSETLEDPDQIRNTSDERRDGRPTGRDVDTAGAPHEPIPTVAPEEEGGSPSTEHAPGGDL